MKKLILILSILAIALTGNAQLQQMWLGGQTGGEVATGLLDQYPGAEAAYALVNLTSAWTGNDVIGVRRSGEISVTGFTETEIIDGTLAAHCTNNCFVQNWYDQSGNTRTATQSDTSKQPLIFSDTLITLGGNPAIYFGGGDQKLTFSVSTAISVPNSTFIVLDHENKSKANPYVLSNGGTGNSWAGLAFIASSNTIRNFILPNVNSGTDSNYDQYSLFSSIQGSSSGTINRNGSTVSTTNNVTGSTTVTNMVIGGFPTTLSSASFLGKMQCAVLYDTDQTINLSAIETIINSIYSIY